MKISALMPTFNRREFIQEAIASVLSQDVDLELIIKDGGRRVADLIPDDPRITYIWNKDRGITDAINQAMRVANGDIMVWTNDDDIVEPGAFKKVLEQIGDAKWLIGKMKTSKGQVSGGGYHHNDMIKCNHVCQPTVYWTREAYEAVGPMDEENDLVSDYEYWLRLGSRYEPKLIEDILATYRIHPDQITSKIPHEQLSQSSKVSKKYENTAR
jgi:glycosyltransferase involved in cell wall biosynthesis